MNYETEQDNAIAVVGMSIRFPGAGTVEEFWNNLRDGVESVSFFTEEELEKSGIPSSIYRLENYVPAKPVLQDIDLFDADFFQFTPKEASLMDPQQRLFLECAWEALESAGYHGEDYPGPIGVFGGVGESTYFLFHIFSRPDLLEQLGKMQSKLFNDKDFLSTRVSYKLNLQGPSMTVQTACSTALVNVHLACQSLLNGESDMALAGAASVAMPNKSGYLYEEGNIYSDDGHCRAFDKDSGGTIFGDGVGIVLLKRLEDALKDGDTIHAVIKGSAMNNDGSMKIGFTAPSARGQAKVIAEALSMAETPPETIGYIETHGTGTKLGDMIEIEALKQCYDQQDGGKIVLGSVKTNVGHLNTAAGIAGLVKTILILKRGQIPPTLHFSAPNPRLGLEASCFDINTSLVNWESGNEPRRASVSSFGVGGTNVHLVLEEAQPLRALEEQECWQVLPLSAKTPGALEQMTENLKSYLARNETAQLSDVAYTLQFGRKAFSNRRLLVCSGRDEAIDLLQHPEDRRVGTLLHQSLVSASEPYASILMFPSIGGEYFGIGSELFETFPVVKREVERCNVLFNSHLGIDVRAVVASDGSREEPHEHRLDSLYSLPVNFTMEYALASLLLSWGIQPAAVIGCGTGEYAAACVSGILSLENAVALVSARVRLILTAEATSSSSGEPEPGITAFKRTVDNLEFQTPHIAFVSSVTGTWISEAEASDPSYWLRHLQSPERFEAGIQQIMLHGSRFLFSEVGPLQVLSSRVQRMFAAQGQTAYTFSTLKRFHQEQSEVSMLLYLGGMHWVCGQMINWKEMRLDQGPGRRIPLPTYPFERKRHWVEPNLSAVFGGKKDGMIQHLPGMNEAEDSTGGPGETTKEEQTELIITGIFEDILGVERPGPQDNFFALGGNSLVAAQFLSKINHTFQAQFSMELIFMAPTVQGIAAEVNRLRSEQMQDQETSVSHPAPVPSALDDIHLHPQVADGIRTLASLSGLEIGETADDGIFLTGATGFIGSHVLYELLRETRSDIYCLVRALTPQEAMERISSVMQRYWIWTEDYRGRIIPVLGNLDEERLGISEEQFAGIAGKTSVIYHMAAWVNWIYPYSELRAANVLGTKEIIRLASYSRLKPVHFMSSVAVFDSQELPLTRVCYENEDIRHLRSFQTGYAESKWASEQLLLKARACGLPVSIFRSAYVTGSSLNGISNINDFVFRMVKGCIQIGAAPYTDLYVNVTPVDFVARSIVLLSRQRDVCQPVYHITNPETETWLSLLEWIQSYGYVFDLIPVNDWNNKLEQAIRESKDNALTPFLFYFAPEKEPHTPGQEIPVQGKIYDMQNTEERLTANSIVCPKVDASLLTRYFDYLVDCGFLVSPFAERL
ncbi:Phthiocerol/phenolphthiocerol synthesis polyketide synthase type I PpsE [compost metagenome]